MAFVFGGEILAGFDLAGFAPLTRHAERLYIALGTDNGKPF